MAMQPMDTATGISHHPSSGSLLGQPGVSASGAQAKDGGMGAGGTGAGAGAGMVDGG